MRKRIGMAAAGIAVLALLAGCAPATVTQSAPGLGGSDGGEDAGANGAPRGVRLTLDAAALPAGTTATMTRKDGNCVRSEFDGAFDLATEDQFMMEIFAGSFDCTTQWSWATWTLTATLPDKTKKSTTLEIAQVPTDPGSYVAKCWGDGALTCKGVYAGLQREVDSNWSVAHPKLKITIK